ncbi:MAG: hypothetical protein IPG56_14960 [Caulobacteraceae bacterium]|nr:hypothetical protein [Caulobacteraceae bacterium]
MLAEDAGDFERQASLAVASSANDREMARVSHLERSADLFKVNFSAKNWSSARRQRTGLQGADAQQRKRRVRPEAAVQLIETNRRKNATQADNAKIDKT